MNLTIPPQSIADSCIASVLSIKQRRPSFADKVDRLIRLKPGEADVIPSPPGGPLRVIAEAERRTGNVYHAQTKTERAWSWIVERRL